MTSSLTPLVLIGVLLAVGLLVGVALVLMTWLRDRRDARAIRDEPPTPTERDRAA